MSELAIVIEGELMARIRADRAGRLTLDYETTWRESSQGHSLSMSMPRAQITYRQRTVLPYLWNLLPENPNVLQRWGQQYHVSPANPLKLLSFVGAEVPGAAQFLPPQHVDDIRLARKQTIEWMSVDELSERLRQLRADIAAVRRPGDAGKMSLPGAQAKTAFYWDEENDRWGVPAGRTPTTHIIKPCIPGFPGFVENEHLCQDIAARVGLTAAKSRVLELDEPCIVIERYDRLPALDKSAFVQRIHQEDLCQALGLMPARKYQQDGGPGIPDIVALIRRVSSAPEQDVERFLRANMFNWLIGGTDAHAKNYSFLIAAGDEVRLAPLYDVSSQLPYADMIAQHVSMKIGDRYDIARIGTADWLQLADACAIDGDSVRTMLTGMARALPDHISAARDQALRDGLAEGAVAPLARQLIAHAAQRLDTISGHRQH